MPRTDPNREEPADEAIATPDGAERGGLGAPELRKRLTAATAATVPGVLAGAHLAGLLFFLNPDLPFSFGLLLRGVAVYSPVVALVSLVLHLPLVIGSPGKVLRLLPWTLTGVFGVAGILYGVHASRFAFYLPSGINTRLIKASLWLGLGALVAFYTALLHSLDDRPYGARSRLALWLLAIGSLFAVFERREAYRPRPETLLASSVERAAPIRLVVVGIDGASLDVVLPLAEKGRLPFFAELLRQGTYARLQPLAPVRSEPSWTSLATGKHPYKHGVVSSRSYRIPALGRDAELFLLPSGLGFRFWGLLGGSSRPVDPSDQRSRPLWTILPSIGLSAAAVGWPGPLPGAPGFGIGDDFFSSPPETGRVSPPELAETAALFRVGARDLDPGLTVAMNGSPEVLRALAGDVWRQSATFFLLEQTPGIEAVFLRLPGLLDVAEGSFGGYVARELEGRSSPRIDRAARTLEAYYRYLDDALGQLWRREEGPRIFVAVSPFGVAPPHALRRIVGEATRRPPIRGHVDGDADGILVLRGTGVRNGAFLSRARIEDVVPTVLYGLGLPVARDLDGRVLTGAFAPAALAERPLAFVPSYETVAED